MASNLTIIDFRRAASRQAGVRAGRLRDGSGPISLRTPTEIAGIRAAGDVLRAALDAAADACVVDATTASVDAAALAVIRKAGAESLFLGHPSPDANVGAFPACCCVSINDEIVHGVPSQRVIRDGDLVAIDCGVKLNGWCADAALTVPVGRVSDESIELIECAQLMLAAAVHAAKPGVLWSDIACSMQAMAVENGHGIVVEYVGHGIGRELHEKPQVPNCLSAAFLAHGDFTLRPGMVLAIEPMLTLAGAGVDSEGFPIGVQTKRLADGWTVVAADGSPAVHVEHTVAITRRGCDVLTLGRQPIKVSAA